MWSDKALTNTIINILLFLVGINFWRVGQLILPIICLILFIDNKFELHFNELRTFILLCMFGLTFFLFSYKLGFYSVMGFTLPMAYYIGSNIKYKTKENVIKLVYIICLGMASHLIMNFILDLYILGSQTFTRNFHLDLWFGSNVLPTTTSVNLILPISIIYYLLKYENNKKYKTIGIALLIIIGIYNFALGRRTPIMILIISLFLCLFCDYVIFSRDKSKLKFILKVSIATLLFIVICYVMIGFNIFGIKDAMLNIVLFRKFITHGLDAERIEILIEALKNAPQHMWGGQELSNSIGLQVHDLWMDTFDFAGIIPYLILVVYSLSFVKNAVKAIKKMKDYPSFVVYIISFIICVTLLMMMEPVMTGSTIFLLCTIIIGESIFGINLS